MSMSRKLLLFLFRLAVLFTVLGCIVSYLFPLPVAQLGCFLLAAGLSVCGLFVPQRTYRIAASILFIVAVISACLVYRHTVKYLALAHHPPQVSLMGGLEPSLNHLGG
jgi:hypothetical protein